MEQEQSARHRLSLVEGDGVRRIVIKDATSETRFGPEEPLTDAERERWEAMICPLRDPAVDSGTTRPSAFELTSGGSARPRHLPRLIFDAVWWIVKHALRRSGSPRCLKPGAELSVPFASYQKFATRGKDSQRDRRHFQKRFGTACPPRKVSESGPSLGIKGSRVVWRTPDVPVELGGKFKGPQWTSERVFDLSTRCIEFLDFLWKLLRAEVTECKEGETVALHVMGRRGTTFLHAICEISHRVKRYGLGALFKKRFRCSIVNENRHTAKVVRGVVAHAIPMVSPANLPTKLTTYPPGPARPSLHGCMIVRVGSGRDGAPVRTPVHAFWDHWLEETRLPVYRYLNLAAPLHAAQRNDLDRLTEEMNTWVVAYDDPQERVA